MKRFKLWKVARVGCGTPAVPLEQLPGPSFKALMCKIFNPLLFFLVSATPLMGETARVYVCMYLVILRGILFLVAAFTCFVIKEERIMYK